MKVIYSGRTKEFTPELDEKISAKLAKLGKSIEQRGEREVHLKHEVERHLHKVEMTMNFHDHVAVGEGADSDLPTAVNHAIEKLEKQILRIRTRWRDTHRDAKGIRSSKESWTESLVSSESVFSTAENGTGRRPKIFHVDYDEDRKPMTLEEAMLEMERNVPYVVYRDSSRDCLSVLVRRPDGNYDLIES